MPIGGVAAYRDEISVVGVGFDIACGNAAIQTDLRLEDLGAEGAELQARLNEIADEIYGTVSLELKTLYARSSELTTDKVKCNKYEKIPNIIYFTRT